MLPNGCSPCFQDTLNDENRFLTYSDSKSSAKFTDPSWQPTRFVFLLTLGRFSRYEGINVRVLWLILFHSPDETQFDNPCRNLVNENTWGSLRSTSRARVERLLIGYLQHVTESRSLFPVCIHAKINDCRRMPQRRTRSEFRFQWGCSADDGHGRKWPCVIHSEVA